MAKKSQIDKAIDELGLQLRAANAAKELVIAEHDARIDGLCSAIDALNAQRRKTPKRTPKVAEIERPTLASA